MSYDQGTASPSTPRVVLLGASNLARGISTVAGTAQALIGSPLEFFIAMGHGRSYGRASRVLGRTLPGIDECGLWDALGDAVATQTYALITDIGNDIVYGYDVQMIAAWIEQCLKRLQVLGARTIITRLPVESIESLSNLRYRVAKAILFPGRRLSLDEAKQRIGRLDTTIGDLAPQYGATLVDLPGEWYGMDPVHIKRSQYSTAFAQIMAGWPVGDKARTRATPSVVRWLKLHLARPQRWSFLGIPLGSTQPATRLADGSTVAVF